MERKEIKGEWWLPETPEDRLSGTLTIDHNYIELALFGVLDAGDSTTDSGLTVGSRPAVYPRIHGANGVRTYTLDDCFQIERTGLLDGLTTQQVNVHQVFEGKLFKTDEAIEFTEIVVEMAGLPEFVQRSGLADESEGPCRGGPFTKVVVSLAPQLSRSFVGPHGGECSLVHSWRSGVTQFHERHISENYQLRIKKNKLTSSERLLTEIGYLRDLLSVATDRRAAFTSVSFRHPGLTREFRGLSAPTPVTMYANWVVREEPNKGPIKPHRMFFTLDDLGGVDSLTKWLEVADRHAASLGRVMVARYSDGLYVTDSILNAAAALEGYDREKHGRRQKVDLAVRLERCSDHAGPLFADLVVDVDQFRKRLTKYRNTVAHHLNGVEGSTEQVFVARAAAWLLILCLLRDADAPELVFHNIGKHSEWQWLQSHMAAAMA